MQRLIRYIKKLFSNEDEKFKTCAIGYIQTLIMSKEDRLLSLPLRNRLYVSHMNNIGR
jgi:hypothetical protein